MGKARTSAVRNHTPNVAKVAHCSHCLHEASAPVGKRHRGCGSGVWYPGPAPKPIVAESEAVSEETFDAGSLAAAVNTSEENGIAA